MSEPTKQRKNSFFGKIKEKLRRSSFNSSFSVNGGSQASTVSDDMPPSPLHSPAMSPTTPSSAAAASAPFFAAGGGPPTSHAAATSTHAAAAPPTTSHDYDGLASAFSSASDSRQTDDSGKLVPDSELEGELKIAFAHYSKGLEMIPAREIGYILRSLGQNPTEDDIIALVCEAGCDWEGYLTAQDFLSVALVSMQKQVDRMDDVRAAFRAFDHNGDGSISRDELRDAMQRFGHSFSDDECDEMFTQADLNNDGKIDWDEFVNMMLPGHGDDVDYAAAAANHNACAVSNHK